MAKDSSAGLIRRRSLSDDRHCHRLQPQVYGQPRRHRPTRADLYCGHARDLRAERGEDLDLYFITGADALTQILTWHEVDSIFDLAHFVGCTRPGVDLDSPVIAQLPQDKITLMEVPALAISSTACRLRVERHQPIWYLVPDGIVQYIAKRGLYQS